MSGCKAAGKQESLQLGGVQGFADKDRNVAAVLLQAVADDRDAKGIFAIPIGVCKLKFG